MKKQINIALFLGFLFIVWLFVNTCGLLYQKNQELNFKQKQLTFDYEKILPFPTPSLHDLHSEKSVEWTEAGIENTWVNWKITPGEYENPQNKVIYLQGVWRADFTNSGSGLSIAGIPINITKNKKKRIWITFELLDRDNFVIVSDKKGHDDSGAIYLLPKENKVIEGSFVIDKKMASSAYISRLRLASEDIIEEVQKEKPATDKPKLEKDKRE